MRVLSKWLEVLPRAPGTRHYDAFISYSHAADGQLAPALQWGELAVGRARRGKPPCSVVRTGQASEAARGRVQACPRSAHPVRSARYAIPLSAAGRGAEQILPYRGRH